MMKKYWQFLALVLSIHCSYAQTSMNTLLWKVQMKGNPNVSYIFGTYHTVSPNFFDSLKIPTTKLAESDILFIEEQKTVYDNSKIDLQKEKWDVTKWRSVLSKTQDSIFTQFVLKSEETNLYNYSPLLVLLNLNSLYTKFFCETEPYTDMLMDHHIESLARKLNKTVLSLDTIQTEILNSASTLYTYQQTSLLISGCIRYMSNMLNENLEDCDLFYQYKKLDIDYQLDTDFTKSEAISVLLVERNNRWVHKLKDSFLKKKCFAAVGLRHLFYKQGLIQQLRNLGFIVEPVFM